MHLYNLRKSVAAWSLYLAGLVSGEKKKCISVEKEWEKKLHLSKLKNKLLYISVCINHQCGKSRFTSGGLQNVSLFLTSADEESLTVLKFHV